MKRLEKDLRDMTLDELYESMLGDTRTGWDERSGKIERQMKLVEIMLKIVNLCERCNVRSRANQWAKYCHVTCTGPGAMAESDEPARLSAPPTGRELETMTRTLRRK